MKLRYIAEFNWGKAKKKVNPLLSTMPKHKQKHSKRVGRSLEKAGAGKVATYAGLLHDYLERGGDIEALSDHIGELGLPQKIVMAVQALSQDENDISSANQPLAHLKQVLRGVQNEDLRNIIILAKLADRIDNLRRRLPNISKRYRQKSNELISYLTKMYTGKNKPFRKLIRKYETI
jgi:(p)ppGpp synthase/HD superfamily hydrolase